MSAVADRVSAGTILTVIGLNCVLTLILVLLNYDIGADDFTFIRTKLHLKLILFQANQAPL